MYTGKGKGKTTAALGMALWHYGEMTSSKRLEPEFELTAVGKGFVGIMDDKSPIEDHKKIAQEALKIAQEKISSKKYDIIILDEINYALNLNLIELDDVLKIISDKPDSVNLVLTGNHAKDEIIEKADLVTEMREIKHPFKLGIRAKKGIDF